MKGANMKAKVGDRIVIKGHHVGEHERDREVLEFRHENGEPPHLVRSGDTGHEDLVLPGPEASVVDYEHE
jgi:hypothetical protein